MSLKHRRTEVLPFILQHDQQSTPTPLKSIVQENFEDFIYRDAISRKHYVFGTLKEKKVKLTVTRLKNIHSETKQVIKDVGGHLQILSNIKQFRFHQLLSSSKSLKKLQQQMANAQISKYNQYKQSMLRIRGNMIDSISSYNMDTFRKYMNDDSKFDNRLNIMKRIENGKITQQQLQKFLKQCNEQHINKQPANIQAQEKKKIQNQILLKQFQEQFDNKYKKQYDILEVEIKNKINGQVKYLVEPEQQNYKSVIPLIRKQKKISNSRQQQFQQHLKDIRGKSLDIIQKFSSLNNAPVQADKENITNFEFMKSLIVQNNVFDFQCQINDHPQYIQLVDQKGNSLLHLAVKQSALQISKILIHKKIDISIKNNLGYTAKQLAQHFNQNQIKKEIQKYQNRYNPNY